MNGDTRRRYPSGSQAKPASSATRRHFFTGLSSSANAVRASHSSETSSAYSGSSELAAATVLSSAAAAATAAEDGQSSVDDDPADEREEDSADEEDDDDLPMADADADEYDEEELLRTTSAATSATLGRPPSAVDALRKPPSLRSAAEVAALAASFERLRGFADFTRPAVGQLAEAAIGGVAAPAETLLVDGRELDSWCVVVSGAAELTAPGCRGVQLTVGDAFGARPQQQLQQPQGRQRQIGTVRAMATGCVFARVPLPELQRVLAAEASRTVEVFSSDGSLALVREIRPAPAGSPTQQLQVATRGSPRGLLDQLMEPRCELTDPGFTEDFLLTYPAFYQSGLPVAKRLLGAASNQEEPERSTRAIRVLLTWAGSHFSDFAANPELFGVLLRLDQLLGAAGGEEASGERRLLRLACSAGSASCRNPDPPLALICAAAPPSDFDDIDRDIDECYDGFQLQLRVHRPDGRQRELRLSRCAKVADAVAAARRAFDGPSASVVGELPEADDADEMDSGGGGGGDASMGYRLLEVSVAPGLVVRRRALAPSRPAVELDTSGSGSGRVRFYLAGPREPADLFLASDAEAKDLLAAAEVESPRRSQKTGSFVDFFLATNAKTVAIRLTEADFQLHRQVRPRQLVNWWLSGGGGGGGGGGGIGPLHSLMSVTESESAWAAGVIAQTAPATGGSRRHQALKQLLRVCRHCWRLGNVNSLMSVALSLMGARCSLGPDCRRRLSKKYRSLWLSLEQLADVSMNHAAYRQLVRTGRPTDRPASQPSHHQPKQPFLPYLAILCKDLAALRECGDLHLGGSGGGARSSSGLINFERLRLLAREIRSFCHNGADSSTLQASHYHHHLHHHHQQQQLRSPKRPSPGEESKMEELIAHIRGIRSSDALAQSRQ